jgi:vacuolar protein sorting-associated protein 54
MDEEYSNHRRIGSGSRGSNGFGATLQSYSPSLPEQALREAEMVLESLPGGESRLDGFNLLSVVAVQPRLSLTTATTSLHSQQHQTHHSTAATSLSTTGVGSDAAADTSLGSSSNVLYDTYHTLEQTLSHVTEQVDALNSVLEDWSRQLLDYDASSSYYYDGTAGDESIPESVLKELPGELQNLDLRSLQSYLEASGVLAHAFRQRSYMNSEEEEVGDRAATAMSSTDNDIGGGVEHIMSELDADIPLQFFDPDFDLTDPQTFRDILLRVESAHSKSQDPPLLNADGRLAQGTTDGPVQEWFPLAPQDRFGGFLDKVELALLLQVRSKSQSFFRESQRFALLQEWIGSLVAQVEELSRVTRQLQNDLVDPLIAVPDLDEKRRGLSNLQHALDAAAQLLACKHSVGGLVSAQDDLGAIEQIQYGRRLLAGTAVDDEHATSALENDPNGKGGAEFGRVELHKVLSLQSVADQLNQYEQLVVTNLRDELVEVLLEWNNASVSSLYSTTSSNGYSVLSGKGGLSSQKHEVKERVREIVNALRRCRGLAKSREAYGNRLQEVLRITVRTIVSEFASDSSVGDGSGASTTATTVSSGATAMSLDRFLDCLDMMFEQLLSMLTSASGVNEFCVEEGYTFGDEDLSGLHGDSCDSSITPMASIILSAAELSSKSVSELLRLRKEAHSLVTLEEMKRLWDKCMAFTTQLEALSGHKASALRSTLLAQAKAFIERKHESNMSALVAALDSERWVQCEVSSERQRTLSRLCSGRVTIATSASYDCDDATTETQKAPEVEIEGRQYKVVWSCLLLMEMVTSDLMAASYFTSLASGLVAKVAELLRLFNTRTTNLVLGAGAIHSAARLKSINAKHLSLVTQCLRLVSATLPHVRAGLMAQLPPKQHTLLTVFDQIKKEYSDHNEKILNKFVTIIGGIVEHGLAPKIRGTDFDMRSKLPPSADGKVTCCIFLEGIATNTRKMHQVLSSLLPPDQLQDVFSRIFAFVDQKVPSLFLSTAEDRQNTSNPSFVFPKTDEGKHRLLVEVDTMTNNLNGLEGVRPWEFTISAVLGKYLEIKFDVSPESSVEESPLHEKETAPTTEYNGDSADIDSHPSEVVSESGTEVTTETYTTMDALAMDDPPYMNGPSASDGDEAASPVLENDASSVPVEMERSNTDEDPCENHVTDSITSPDSDGGMVVPTSASDITSL